MQILPLVHKAEFYIKSDLIQHLLKSQVPSRAHARLRPVIPGGTDHVMIQMDGSLIGRLPRHPGAVSAAEIKGRADALENPGTVGLLRMAAEFT